MERISFLGVLARYRRYRRAEQKYIKWKKNGSVLPMPHFGKQKLIAEYYVKFKPSVFFETGTYNGHMVYAMLDKFDEIFSIELNKELYKKNRKRFMGYHHVHLFQGDSGQFLPEILKEIQKPCLFWLDAHWSGGSTAKGVLNTPIIQELTCILNHPRKKEHILLIDDARSYTGQNDYPNLKTLEQLILDANPDWIFKVKDDIIRAHSAEPKTVQGLRTKKKARLK